MQNPAIFITYDSALVCILSSLLLFANRKEGDRSRLILAEIFLFSGLVSAFYFIKMYVTEELSSQSMSTPALIYAFIAVSTFIMYSVEVISPRWLNFKRVAMLYIPVLVIISIYAISLMEGVEYRQYNSVVDMIPYITHFEVWFRLTICLLIFTPTFYLFFIPFTKRYNNTNNVWIRTNIMLISLNSFSHLFVILFCDPFFDIVFYYISSGARLTIVYIELFVRLKGGNVDTKIRTENSVKKYIPVIEEEQIQITDNIEVNISDTDNTLKPKTAILFERLDKYMYENQAWRDPDITMTSIVDVLKTNRTTLAQAIQEKGYESYTAYINKLRIDDFIHIIESSHGIPFQETFYDVGFRSRSTALRSFRRIVGTIPSKYFHKTDDD